MQTKFSAHVACEVTLTSNITDESGRLICPGGVKLTCDALLMDQTTLRWFVNNKQRTIASHTYTGSTDGFPLTILDIPKIMILDASLNITTMRVAFISILETSSSWFVDMDITSVECGTYEETKSLPSYSIRSE